MRSGLNGFGYAVVIPTVLLAAFSGSLLPVWMFFNSLSLLAHVPLLSSALPTNINYFLLDYLNLVRLHSPKLDAYMEAYHKEDGLITSSLIDDDSNAYSALLSSCGYKHDFVRNLFVFICVASLILIVWLGAAVADYLVKRKCKKQNRRNKKQRNSVCVTNCFVRFIYQIFFEICICVFINITVMDQNSFQAGLLWLSSLVIIVVIGVILLVIVSLFWKNGPYVSDSYEEKSWFGSFWGVRALTSEIIEEMEYELEDQKLKEFDHNKIFTTSPGIMLEKETPKFTDAYMGDNSKMMMGMSVSERQSHERVSEE